MAALKDRTDYVHTAAKKAPSRFQLCRIASKATRAMHINDRRIEDTTNNALVLIGKGKPVAKLPPVWIKEDGTMVPLQG